MAKTIVGEVNKIGYFIFFMVLLLPVFFFLFLELSRFGQPTQDELYIEFLERNRPELDTLRSSRKDVSGSFDLDRSETWPKDDAVNKALSHLSNDPLAPKISSVYFYHGQIGLEIEGPSSWVYYIHSKRLDYDCMHREFLDQSGFAGSSGPLNFNDWIYINSDTNDFVLKMEEIFDLKSSHSITIYRPLSDCWVIEHSVSKD